jgi:two-component system sensor histidine kinase BaeS
MRLWRGASLRARLLTATGLVLVVSLGLTLAIGYVLTRRAVEHTKVGEVERKADLLATFESRELLACSRSLEPFLSSTNERATCTTLDAAPYLTPLQQRLLRAGKSVHGSVRVGGTDYYVAARRVKTHAIVFLRAQRTAASTRPYVEALVIAGIAGATVAALVSILLARAIRRPVAGVAAATRSVAAGEKHQELPVDGSGELAQLSRSFNEMAEQLAHAREAEQAFLLSVSHELKTPLTSIRGYAEGLGEGAVPPEEAAGVIRREARRLERLVQDLLDIARMKRHAFAVHREEVDLAETARDAGRRYAAQAQAFGLRLEVDAPAAAPARGDSDRVLQVVSNLVENALRCTPAGEVRVKARPGLLEVSDTGPGLPADELPRAFERFFLYRRHGAERPVGTGLGLAIVKELTEAMGGSVDVRSRPGEGTTFRVSLPSAPQAAVDDAGLAPRGRRLPEQREAALPVQEPREVEVAREPLVAVDDADGAGGGDAVGDRDDVALHRGLEGSA